MKTKNIILLSVAGVLVALLLFVYFDKHSFYKTHFLPKTTANGIDISDMTVKQANEHLIAETEKELFTITDNGIPWKEYPTKTVGVEYNFKEELEKIESKQDINTWFLAGFSNKTHTLESSSINEELLKTSTDTLKKELEEFNKSRTETKNATIQLTDNGFEIIPEVTGNNLDIGKILEAFNKELREGKPTLELEDFAIQPTVLATDEKLNKNLESIHTITKQTVSYQINGQQINVPEATISSWINYDSKENKITLNDDKMTEYLTTLANEQNTSTNATTFNSTARGQVSVPAGTYSWTIAVATEKEALKADLLAGNSVNRSPAAEGSAPVGSALVGSTYIEVDLQNQHMYYYKDGAVQLETDIVSGKPSMATPTGVFYVWNKESNATLKGTNEDGSKYATPVSYWMPIDWGGVGIHDSSWQPAYGGSLWQTVGSHGCINTPPNVMSQLFGMVEVGTPVLVF